MKLTEQQLQNLFQDNSQAYQANVKAGDCLTFDDASNQRLQHAEELLNDFTAAQAMKTTFALKEWSAQIAKSIDHHSVSSWFNWVSHPFKTSATACAFAFVLFAALPNITHNEQQMQPLQATHTDVISSTPFESDVLSSGSFDNKSDNDSLFNGSFG